MKKSSDLHQFIEPGNLVLFTGDSITDAFRKPEEINIAYQLGAGYAMMIGARLMAERPEAGLRFANRGISGQRIEQLAERWDEECLQLRPDVVSILIGVNSTLDKYRKPAPPRDADHDVFREIYDQILRLLRKSRPGVRIVLGEPFLLPCGDVTPEMLVDIRERAAIVRDLAETHQAIFVPFQKTFDQACSRAPAEYWIYDGVHPTAAGFWLMAETWHRYVIPPGQTAPPAEIMPPPVAVSEPVSK